MRKIFATALVLMGMLSSCNSQSKTTVNGEKLELENGLYAKFETTLGDILVQLNTEKAPLTTANFVALAEGTHPKVSEEYQGKPFYDGLTFHRVIPKFMIQGGDPQGNGMGGPGYQFDNETSPELSHEKGVISMANSGPNTNGSQFFITVAPTKQLDGSYNVFGKVVAGQNVADSISMVPRNNRDKPDEDVVMQTVSIVRKGKEAKNFDAPAVFSQMEEEKAAEQEAAKAAEQAKIDELTQDAQKTESGLYYQVLKEGEGPKPAEGQTVLTNYSGYLVDGTLFDSSVESVAKEGGKYNPQRTYEPFPVQVGPQARVIAGWKEALSMMQVGDTYKLIIPPELGYGARGAGGVIPPNAWLIFEVEMVKIKE
jgi:peptidylprolyl isomerase